MSKNEYYHQKLFRILYRDAIRRIEKYKAILKIRDVKAREELEQRFLNEQRQIIRRFIAQEKYAEGKLREGLKRQQKDIESWWKRNIEFRKVKGNCIDRFNNLIVFAKKVKEILDKSEFDQKDLKALASKIEDEMLTLIHLNEDYQIRKYGEGILAFCKRNTSLTTLAILFLFVSSLSVYFLSNYNIVPRDTQTLGVKFVPDNITSYDWAQGAHYSYGFHTMLDRIVGFKSYLRDLSYKSYKDANKLEIYKGASKLLPEDIKNILGDNIILEVQALNKGEILIKIVQNGSIILEVRFVQDKVGSIGANSRSFSSSQLEEMYHSIRRGIEERINSN